IIQKGVIEKKVKISLDIDQYKFYVQANEFLRDIIENILDNAVKYNTNQIVKVVIRIREEQINENVFIKLEFIDNGIGIKNRDKKAIFRRGYRVDGNVSGRGLGLSLSMRILSSYNGKIWVEDNVEGDHTKGSNFILLIPKAIL
ncbi:MAG: sensor histidine kinase, partial [Promethearchaeota archaeon]